MNVVVNFGNGKTINPVYSPEHRETVVSFYRNLIANNEVSSVVITFDDGEVMTMVEG